jgi:hypothetical protein
MGQKKRADIGKVLRAQDGRSYRVTQILVARQTGEERCEGFVHGHGWVTFVGRSCRKMPEIKFRHCKSKFKNLCQR